MLAIMHGGFKYHENKLSRDTLIKFTVEKFELINMYLVVFF